MDGLDSLDFDIKENHKLFYTVFIERGRCIRFNSRSQAEKFIRKYKDTIFDNVLMLNHLYGSLSSIKTLFFNGMPVRQKLESVDLEKRYNEQYIQIFHNRGGDERATVQFNKVRVCFDVVEDYIIFLKNYAQRYKRAVIARQLKPIEKFYLLVVKSYGNDLDDLERMNLNGGKVVELKTRKNEICKIVHGRKA